MHGLSWRAHLHRSSCRVLTRSSKQPCIACLCCMLGFVHLYPKPTWVMSRYVWFVHRDMRLNAHQSVCQNLHPWREAQCWQTSLLGWTLNLYFSPFLLSLQKMDSKLNRIRQKEGLEKLYKWNNNTTLHIEHGGVPWHLPPQALMFHVSPPSVSLLQLMPAWELVFKKCFDRVTFKLCLCKGKSHLVSSIQHQGKHYKWSKCFWLIHTIIISFHRSVSSPWEENRGHTLWIIRKKWGTVE